ncbi:MAG: MBL fold metallo-hydrolase [Verrucomicrobiaceae bacterium]|nr:MAG: MBL fold metallo-hydrolase [Verrucomicrobiaceae bacterium]
MSPPRPYLPSSTPMVLRLAQCGVNPLEIDGILLTHEHQDHACGIDVWFKQFSTPIYCNRLTAEILRKSNPDQKKDWRIFTTGADFKIGDLDIQSFSVPHDAVEPVGFVLHHGKAALGFLTDLGFATKLVYERVRQVHTLVIETNHDEQLLQNDTKRPWSVKQRIMSRHGHLSNAAAANVIVELLGTNLRRTILGHLSSDCNSPELAIGTVRERIDPLLGGQAVEVVCATRKEVTPRILVGDTPAQGTFESASVEPETIIEIAQTAPADTGECAGTEPTAV